MFLLDDQVIYSASDLAAAASCEFGLLRKLDSLNGLVPRVAAEPDPMLERTSALGLAHERTQLARFEEQFPGGVLTMERPGRTGQELADADWSTFTALTSRTPVLYQATFFDGRFLGFCDFLVADGDRYGVYDTKLSRHAKVPALLQLAAYADSLQRGGITPSDHVHLMLGDGSTSSHTLTEILAVYRQSRENLQRILDEHQAEGTAVGWADAKYSACGRCDTCSVQVEEHRDLILVAGMRSSARERLIDAGISTIEELAASAGPVNGMSDRTSTSLRAQAALQVRQERTGAAEFDIFDARGLGSIPEPDPGDIFFDFEGDPLWADPAHPNDWGLEYLFGVLNTDLSFEPFWAHDRSQERQALIDFLAYVTARRAEYPNMHVYHYAPYEKTALLRLAGRYGVGEDVVDDLLRHEVLVDLYPIVRTSVRIGARSYSIKKLEPLYMPEDRSGDVTNAAASIVEYAHWCEFRDAGEDAAAAELLNEIAEYNRTDCVSTIELRDWLLARASDAGVTPRKPSEPVVEREDTATPLEISLGEYAGLPWNRTSAQQAVAMYAGAVGFHRRERKPFWWAHFDRLTDPVDEWADAADVMKIDHVQILHDWMKTAPRQRVLRRKLRLVGELSNGVIGGVGHTVRLLYDNPSPEGLDKLHPTHRGSSMAKIVDVGFAGTRDAVIVEESLRAGTEPYFDAPIATAPDRPVPTASLESAIETAATEVDDALPDLPLTAVADLMALSPPRTTSGNPLPPVNGSDYASAITAALLDLDHSYLAVQGPPGTGKTYTASKVIAHLVREHHWRIGVVGQSHMVVDNLLATVVEAGVDARSVGKKAPTEQTVLKETEYPGFVADADRGCVIGGTAWDFSHSTRVVPGSLDLLVIDEAGQFSLANTIAVAGAARNLLLLGDPQQLPQVSQGTHPEPVDRSALGWLAAGHGALPADRGYFLATTWRMHPALCAPVSALAYEGRLESNREATEARNLDGLAPGLHTVLVDHHGNSTSSPEEAAEIATRIQGLIGNEWTDPASFEGTRALAASDFLVVAAYNAQVAVILAHLAEVGLDDVLVGTVDKIQGRQAPVVLVSMAASSVDDVPRGMGFLLSRNRLNVAISRGQWAAFLIRSRSLTQHLPTTPDGLVTLGTFMALSNSGHELTSRSSSTLLGRSEPPSVHRPHR